MSSKKNSKKKQHASVIINIYASFNNTLISITDPSGNLLVWSSAGRVGFKNARRSTPYAAQRAMSEAIKQAKAEYGIKRANVTIEGPGFGREPALRSLIGTPIEVLAIIDKTSVPHNGCRAPKRRRL